MRNDREQAIVMRKAGSGYNEIKARLGIPKSTLSDWFRDQKWSNDIAIECARKARNTGAVRLMILNTVRGTRLRKVYEDARQDAFVDYHELKFHPLFIAGVMIYLGHGDKKSRHRVSISSSDVRTVRIFNRFLVSICRAKNVRASLNVAANSDEEACKAYWIENSGLKGEYFTKTQRTVSKKSTNKPYFGVCNMLVNSAYLKNKILHWIELMTEEIGDEKYVAGIENNAGIV